MYLRCIDVVINRSSFLVVALVAMSMHFSALSKQAQNVQFVQPTSNVDEYFHTKLDNITSLLVVNNYEDAELALNKLNNLANEHGNKAMLGLVHVTFGKLFYQKKQYQNAITQYNIATTFIDEKEDNSQKLLALCYHQIAQSYKHLKNLPKSIIHYKKALAIHSLRQDYLATAKALKNIAMAENKQKNYISALDNAKRSLDIQSIDNTSSGYAQIVLLTGIIYRNIGYYEKSLEYIQQAKEIYEQKDDVVHLAEVDNQIGLIYSKLNQLNASRSFYHQTIDLPIDKVKPETRAAAFRELGVADYHAGDFVRSIEMLNKALDIYLSINSHSSVTRVYLLIGVAYLKMENSVLAKRYIKKSLALAIQLKQLELEIESLNYLGQITLEGNVDEATLLLERSLSLSQKMDNKAEQIKSYTWLTQSEKIKGNMTKALYYSEQKYMASLLMQKQHEALDLANAKAMLESYKLEMDLKNLREKSELDTLKLRQQNSEIEIIQQTQHISELEIRRERLVNIFLIMMLVVCAIVVLFILHSFKKAKVRNQELDYLASRDPLTDCFNRRILFERFKKHFRKDSILEQYSVILADVDSFKAINDNYGHSTGDLVLKSIAKILQERVGEHDVVARFGGEEFCILLPTSRLEKAVQIAENMRNAIEMSEFEGINVTCSFGVASLDPNIEFHLNLIERADVALYQSKYQGRNTVTVWKIPTN